MTVLELERKKLITTLLNQKQNFAWVLILMVMIAISLLREIKSKFKAGIKNANFLNQLCLGSISEKLVSLKEMCMIFYSIAMLLINLKF